MRADELFFRVCLELSIDVAGGPQPIPTVTVDDIDEATLLEQQIQAGEKVGTEEVVAGEVVGVVCLQILSINDGEGVKCLTR